MKNIIIIVVVIVVVVAGAMMVMNKSKSANTTANQQTASQDAMKNDSTSGDQQGVMVGGALMTPDKDIVDNAVGSNDHTTLVAAVKAAGLVETLKSAGPFTVFAPTNEAFDKLPAGTVDTLLKPENKEKLTGVLTYHVVKGALRSSDLKDGMTLDTVNGQKLTVTEKDGKWYVNDAQITIADVISSNGVTHVVDSVILPK